LPIHFKEAVPECLAVGAHLKNAVALTVEDNVFVSQHIGDLENKEALDAFKGVIESFRRLYQIEPARVVADMHPDYVSTRYARECGIPMISIQHHHAHVAACMAENEIDGRTLGVCWDGTGYGTDGTVWGGEFLLADETGFVRTASFRPFRLPGGSSAVREPRRAALGLLFEVMGDTLFEHKNSAPVCHFTDSEISVLGQMLAKGIQSPWTSSVGRLFDAVASISGLRQQINFEGQAAMELEFSMGSCESEESYAFSVLDMQPDTPGATRPITIDWEPMIRAVLNDSREEIPLATISIKFHNTLVEMILAIARCVSERRVVLTGGCFQNKYLLERAVGKLSESGFKPYWHQRIPPNDGGIALGQIAAASRSLRKQGLGQ
jgi:hydrogenase maturation protein HypF